ncbi:MAG: hypothetical protein Q8M09_05570 [Pseudomonadota bacterium]|nr:hypothetical protein [Pseudomonadota bacterium]MDP1903701.1 hypothetical protein [Pseudomonadota bacterium]MDP2351240.1 hypothetical protein [Pseudomonadota bacterium]
MRRWTLIFLLAWCAPSQAEPVAVNKTGDMLQALDDLALAAANQDLSLVKMQPIDTALAKRGYENPHIRILFLGSASAVRWAEVVEPRLLNLLPLRLTLIQREGRVTVMSDDFEPWLREFPEDPAHQMLLAWRAELKAMLDDFMRQ